MDARNDALLTAHLQEALECWYMATPLIEKNGLMSDMVVSHNNDSGTVSLTMEQMLMYL